MPLTPDYGETLLLHEELESLLPQARELLGEPIRLYGDIWSWAGRFRTREVNMGVAPMEILVDLRNAVRTHPFIDGNGRTTRQLADLVFVAAQEVDPALVYDWDVDKSRYIQLLREYDRTRDARPLTEFVKTTPAP